MIHNREWGIKTIEHSVRLLGSCGSARNDMIARSENTNDSDVGRIRGSMASVDTLMSPFGKGKSYSLGYMAKWTERI